MLGDIETIYCQNCGPGTNHDVIGYAYRFEPDPYMDEYSDHHTHEMLRCRGCNKVMMLHRLEKENGDSSTFYYVDGIHDEIYFTKVSYRRKRPRWSGVPLAIDSLISEIYLALENGLFTLATMAIRSVLENVMKDKVGDRPFKVLVDEFQKAGYLSTRQALSLDSIIEAGHATIHRGWKPSREDVDIILDITESVVQMVYLHEDRARALDQRVPRRGKPTPGNQSPGKKT